MIPLEILTYARHLDLPDIKNPTSPHFSLPTKQEQPAPEVPTWRRWLVVLGAFLALFCSFGQLSSFGTYLSWYSHNQLGSYPLSTISWIGSLQLWAFFFSGVLVGRCFDHYGPRPLLIIGAVTCVSSVMMISWCKSYYQYILAQGILFGLGSGLMFYPSISSVATHFTEYRATALGITAAGSSTGGIIFPIMLRRLFVQVGFPSTIRILASVCSLCCCISILTITAVCPPSSTRFRPKDYISRLNDSRYLLLLIGTALISFGLYTPFLYIVDFVQKFERAGSSEDSLSTYVLAIVSVGGLVGRIVPAALSDRIGHFNILFPCALLSGVSCLALWLPTSFVSSPDGRIALEVTFALSFGFFSGGFIALINACITQISKTEEVGTGIGLLYCLISFPSVAGGPVAGLLPRSNSHAYTGMILFAGTTTIVGSFFVLWARFRVESRLLVHV